MFKKALVLTTAVVLTIGTATIAFAKGKNDNTNNSFSNIKPKTVAYQSNKTNVQSNMFDIMEQNGYGDMVNAMKNGDYKAMSNFMSNLSDKDYQNMINIMKNNGYAGMANMMQSIGKNGMIQMHNAMINSGNFGGMMGRSVQNQ